MTNYFGESLDRHITGNYGEDMVERMERELPKIKTIRKDRLKEFIREGRFDIHTTNGDIRRVGLKWGESKRLKSQFSRTEQIKMLNYLERNTKLTKKLFNM